MSLNRPPFNDPQTREIIGAGMDVHNELGCGFLEAVYRRPFAIELRNRNVPFVSDKKFPVIYKSQPTGAYYVADFFCFDDIVVELKAQKSLTPIDQAQTINYLKLAKRRRGLILNFGARRLEWRRIVLGPVDRCAPPSRGEAAGGE